MFCGKCKIIPVISVFLLLLGCRATKQPYDATRKIPAEQLQKDYLLFRHVLEESHPSLYWYTSKDSMDHFFDLGYSRITDSMTEPSFRMLLSYVISKMHCGHTQVKPSKPYERLARKRSRFFPLSLVPSYGYSAGFPLSNS